MGVAKTTEEASNLALEPISFINERNSLYTFIELDNDELVKAYIKAGADINKSAGGPSPYDTPFLKAVEKGKIDIIKLMFEKGVISDQHKKKAIACAVKYNLLKILELILKQTNPNTVWDLAEEPPTFMAALLGNAKALQLLVDGQFFLNYRDKEGKELIHILCGNEASRNKNNDEMLMNVLGKINKNATTDLNRNCLYYYLDSIFANGLPISNLKFLMGIASIDAIIIDNHNETLLHRLMQVLREYIYSYYLKPNPDGFSYLMSSHAFEDGIDRFFDAFAILISKPIVFDRKSNDGLTFFDLWKKLHTEVLNYEQACENEFRGGDRPKPDQFKAYTNAMVSKNDLINCLHDAFMNRNLDPDTFSALLEGSGFNNGIRCVRDADRKTMTILALENNWSFEIYRELVEYLSFSDICEAIKALNSDLGNRAKKHYDVYNHLLPLSDFLHHRLCDVHKFNAEQLNSNFRGIVKVIIDKFTSNDHRLDNTFFEKPMATELENLITFLNDYYSKNDSSDLHDDSNDMIDIDTAPKAMMNDLGNKADQKEKADKQEKNENVNKQEKNEKDEKMKLDVKPAITINEVLNKLVNFLQFIGNYSYQQLNFLSQDKRFHGFINKLCWHHFVPMFYQDGVVKPWFSPELCSNFISLITPDFCDYTKVQHFKLFLHSHNTLEFNEEAIKTQLQTLLNSYKYNDDADKDVPMEDVGGENDADEKKLDEEKLRKIAQVEHKRKLLGKMVKDYVFNESNLTEVEGVRGMNANSLFNLFSYMKGKFSEAKLENKDLKTENERLKQKHTKAEEALAKLEAELAAFKSAPIGSSGSNQNGINPHKRKEPEPENQDHVDKSAPSGEGDDSKPRAKKPKM